MYAQPKALARSLISWPMVILISAALAGYLTFTQDQTAARPAASLWFLLICPGMVFVRMLHLRNRVAELTLAVALSITLNTLLSGAMLYAGMWAPATGLLLLICLCVGGLAMQLGLWVLWRIEAPFAASARRWYAVPTVLCVLFATGVMLLVFVLLQPFVPPRAAFEAPPQVDRPAAAAPAAPEPPLFVLAPNGWPSIAVTRTAVDMFAVVLLIVLLTQKEIVRSLNRPSARRWVRLLDAAIVPLMCVFIAVVTYRLLDLMRII